MMKKRITRAAAVLLLVCLLVGVRTVPLKAVSSNLLTNSGFESGTTGWTAAGGGTLTAGTVSTTTKRTGNRAMKVEKPANQNYFDMVQNPLSKMQQQGSGIYAGSCWVMGTKGMNVKLAIKLIPSSGQPIYRQSTSSVTLSDESWKELSCAFVDDPSLYERVEFYWTTGDATAQANAITLYVDDCSLKFYHPSSEMTTPDDAIVPAEKTLVGAIRWDAYFSTSSSPTSYTIADQVARTLSYYPGQAPYFTKVRTPADQDVTLKFTSAGVNYKIDDVTSSSLTTKTIAYTYGTTWESEARYAMNAGLDYFAYLWYNSTHTDKRHDKMALPRLAHVAQNGYLPDGRQMKMCGIITPGSMNGFISDGLSSNPSFNTIHQTRKELYQAMAQSCYLCIEKDNGQNERIPVVYIYAGGSAIDSDPDVLRKIRDEAIWFTNWLHTKNPEKYQTIDDIYFVAMGDSFGNTDSTSLQTEAKFRAAGVSAVTRYGDGASAGNYSNQPDYQTKNITRYEYNAFPSSSAGTTVTAKSVGYARLSGKNYDNNNRYAGIQARISCVPLATAGWNCLPRIKTGVSWTGNYGLSYDRTGTPAEIARNVSKTIAWTTAHPDAARTNLMLIYAWNEHDEGGWICPTVKTDANGNILTDGKGNALVDSSILDAISSVLWADKEALKGDINGDGEVDAIDRVLLSRALAGWNVDNWVVRLQCGDVNGDGAVDATDRVKISRYLAGWIGYDAHFEDPYLTNPYPAE